MSFPLAHIPYYKITSCTNFSRPSLNLSVMLCDIIIVIICNIDVMSCQSALPLYDHIWVSSFLAKAVSISTGSGNMIVLLFSAATVCSVWRYLSCSAVPDLAITSAASFKAREALCSPSAAITYKQQVRGHVIGSITDWSGHGVRAWSSIFRYKR